jgi:chromosome partitioning protein
MNLTFLSPKGGVGKTTLAIATLTLLNEGTTPVTAFDCDDQQGLALWKNNSIRNQHDMPLINVFPINNPEDLKDKIVVAAKQHHHVIFDTKGARSALATEACGFSDAVIVPTMMDIQSIERTIEVIMRVMPEIRKTKGRDIPAFVVLNNVNMIDSMTKSTAALINHLQQSKIPVLNTQVKQRPIYKAIQNYACSFETVGGTSAASGRQEIYDLLQEINSKLAQGIAA